MIPNCTLTTACFCIQEYNPHARSIEKTIENIKMLLEQPCYLVIYCDKITYPFIKKIREMVGLSHLTQFKLVELKDLWTWQYRDKIISNREIYWPSRDLRTSAETHIICCNKIDFVLKTIEENPFNTTRFGWIDNIGPNGSNISRKFENNSLLYILNNITDNFHIQILNVEDKKFKLKENKKEYYNRYRWLVCGGLFTTGGDVGIKILNRLKEIFIETTNLGFGHGEEMLFLEILDEHYNDICKAYGDYKDIIHNFIKPTSNLDYIYNTIIKNYNSYSYHKECYDACSAVLDQYEKYNIPINYEIYVGSLFLKYVSSYYYKRDESKTIADKLLNLSAINSFFKIEFDKNKEFYLNQLKYVL